MRADVSNTGPVTLAGPGRDWDPPLGLPDPEVTALNLVPLFLPSLLFNRASPSFQSSLESEARSQEELGLTAPLVPGPADPSQGPLFPPRQQPRRSLSVENHAFFLAGLGPGPGPPSTVPLIIIIM